MHAPISVYAFTTPIPLRAGAACPTAIPEFPQQVLQILSWVFAVTVFLQCYFNKPNKDSFGLKFVILPSYTKLYFVFVIYCTFRMCMNTYFLFHNSQNAMTYNCFGKVVAAWIFVGMWHGWEWTLMTLIYQRNGGWNAFLQACYIGIFAHCIYTPLWSIYLINPSDIFAAVFYVGHGLCVTIWFVSIMRYQKSRKQRTAKLFYVYIISYTTFLVSGFLLRAYARPTYFTCRVVWVGFYLYGALDAVILWIILKKDTSYWRHIADEITSMSTVSPKFQTEYVQSFDTLTEIAQRMVPVFDFRLFTTESLIGYGATAVVEKCKYKGNTVAVKAFMTYELSLEHVAIIFREAFVSRQLSHENIVELLGVSFRPPEVCIVYEYCGGGPLVHFIANNDTKLDFRLRLLLDAAKGVRFLHSNNLAHRDLKSENILVHSYNGRITAKLCDFGTAKRFTASTRKKTDVSARSRGSRRSFGRSEDFTSVAYDTTRMSSTRTMSNDRDRTINYLATTRIGTPIYLAPEILKHLSVDVLFGDFQEISVALDEVRYDLSVDIYSFSMVMWEVWTEERVYSHEERDFKDLLKAIVEDHYRPYTSPPQTGVETMYFELMAQSWSGDPHNRPTIHEVCIVLEKLISSDPAIVWII